MVIVDGYPPLLQAIPLAADACEHTASAAALSQRKENNRQWVCSQNGRSARVSEGKAHEQVRGEVIKAGLALPSSRSVRPTMVGTLVVEPELLDDTLDSFGDGARRTSGVLLANAVLSGLHEHPLVPLRALAVLPRLGADVAELLAAEAGPVERRVSAEIPIQLSNDQLTCGSILLKVQRVGGIRDTTGSQNPSPKRPQPQRRRPLRKRRKAHARAPCRPRTSDERSSYT